jgi:cell division protein FtsB
VNSPGEVIAFMALMMMLLGGFVALGPIGRALAERLRGKGRERALESGEVEVLREEVASLRQEVAELAERQDFAERLLAQAREKGLLQAPRDR